MCGVCFIEEIHILKVKVVLYERRLFSALSSTAVFRTYHFLFIDCFVAFQSGGRSSHGEFPRKGQLDCIIYVSPCRALEVSTHVEQPRLASIGDC